MGSHAGMHRYSAMHQLTLLRSENTTDRYLRNIYYLILNEKNSTGYYNYYQRVVCCTVKLCTAVAVAVSATVQCRRRILHVSRKVKAANQELRSKAGYDQMELYIMHWKWNWTGHTLKKYSRSVTKQC